MDGESPRVSEQLLIERLDDIELVSNSRIVLAGSLGRAQLARTWATRWPQITVACNFLDLYAFERAVANGPAAAANLLLTCQSDWVQHELAAAALPLSFQGDAELTRETLYTVQRQLAVGGTLWAATDFPDDRWLKHELDRLFDRVSGWKSPQGVVYRATKLKSSSKTKHHAAKYSFRDRDHLFTVTSRPGVFGHRSLDLGARALLESVEVRPGDRVVDIGCGVGVLSLAVAKRAAEVEVLALDSNPRAVDCMVENARGNELPRIRAVLDASISAITPAGHDLVVANPPYYSNHRIARLFVDGAGRALRAGGRLYLVTKSPQWYVDYVLGFAQSDWKNLQLRPARGYTIVTLERTAGS